MSEAYTDDQVRALPAGAELRRLTAEAMGFELITPGTVFDCVVEGNQVTRCLDYAAWVRPQGRSYHPVGAWYPDTDSGDAALVLEWIRERRHSDRRCAGYLRDELIRLIPEEDHFDWGADCYAWLVWRADQPLVLCKLLILLARRLGEQR